MAKSPLSLWERAQRIWHTDIHFAFPGIQDAHPCMEFFGILADIF